MYKKEGLCPTTETKEKDMQPSLTQPMQKYQRKLSSNVVDVYDVLTAFNVTNPATAHAIKKLLCPGLRGHKDKLVDLLEASEAIERAIQLEEE